MKENVKKSLILQDSEVRLEEDGIHLLGQKCDHFSCGAITLTGAGPQCRVKTS